MNNNMDQQYCTFLQFPAPPSTLSAAGAGSGSVSFNVLVLGMAWNDVKPPSTIQAAQYAPFRFAELPGFLRIGRIA